MTKISKKWYNRTVFLLLRRVDSLVLRGIIIIRISGH